MESKNVPPGNGHATEGKEHFLGRVRFAARGDAKFDVEEIEDVMQHECPSRPFHLIICMTFCKRNVATTSRCDRIDVAKCTIP